MKRVGIYARVSTSEQSVDVQLDQLREYAAARGFTVVGEFVDAGISGHEGLPPGRRGNPFSGRSGSSCTSA